MQKSTHYEMIISDMITSPVYRSCALLKTDQHFILPSFLAVDGALTLIVAFEAKKVVVKNFRDLCAFVV